MVTYLFGVQTWIFQLGTDDNLSHIDRHPINTISSVIASKSLAGQNSIKFFGTEKKFRRPWIDLQKKNIFGHFRPGAEKLWPEMTSNGVKFARGTIIRWLFSCERRLKNEKTKAWDVPPENSSYLIWYYPFLSKPDDGHVGRPVLGGSQEGKTFRS